MYTVYVHIANNSDYPDNLQTTLASNYTIILNCIYGYWMQTALTVLSIHDTYLCCSFVSPSPDEGIRRSLALKRGYWCATTSPNILTRIATTGWLWLRRWTTINRGSVTESIGGTLFELKWGVRIWWGISGWSDGTRQTHWAVWEIRYPKGIHQTWIVRAWVLWPSVCCWLVPSVSSRDGLVPLILSSLSSWALFISLTLSLSRSPHAQWRGWGQGRGCCFSPIWLKLLQSILDRLYSLWHYCLSAPWIEYKVETS